MAPFVAATLLSVTPAPMDYLAASADLHAPAECPPLTERSPRMRTAMLVVMVQAGALDADAPDHRWFAPDLAWESELRCARGVVARVRDCPADDAPPRAWFAGMAAAAYADAAAWRRQAEEYRGRAGFEGHQSDDLLAWASWMDAVADGLSADACRFSGWAGPSWQRPRRIVAQEFRTWGR